MIENLSKFENMYKILKKKKLNIFKKYEYALK